MKIIITLAIFSIYFSVNLTAYAQENCPVSNTELDHSTSVKFSYTGTQFELCSDKCLSEFKDEPILYMEKALCIPCNDDDAKPELTFVHEDVKYYFCNQNCLKKFSADSEKYLEKFNEQR